jgi:hypothetical protein
VSSAAIMPPAGILTIREMTPGTVVQPPPCEFHGKRSRRSDYSFFCTRTYTPCSARPAAASNYVKLTAESVRNITHAHHLAHGHRLISPAVADPAVHLDDGVPYPALQGAAADDRLFSAFTSSTNFVQVNALSPSFK